MQVEQAICDWGPGPAWEWKLKFENRQKISTAFVFMLQDMTDVTKSNWGLSVHLVPKNMWNEDQELTATFNLH